VNAARLLVFYLLRIQAF